MLQYEVDVPMYQLSEMIGEDGAARCYKAGIEAIHNLRDLVKITGVDCGFEMKESLFIAHSKKASGWLKKEFSIRNKHDLGVQWLDTKTVEQKYGLISHGAILSEVAFREKAISLQNIIGLVGDQWVSWSRL